MAKSPSAELFLGMRQGTASRQDIATVTFRDKDAAINCVDSE